MGSEQMFACFIIDIRTFLSAINYADICRKAVEVDITQGDSETLILLLHSFLKKTQRIFFFYREKQCSGSVTDFFRRVDSLTGNVTVMSQLQAGTVRLATKSYKNLPILDNYRFIRTIRSTYVYFKRY
jgi:hypothetical protein